MAEPAAPPAAAPPLGTTALRHTVAAARAVAGAADRVSPAPPPDSAETPWASHREPRPVTQEDERRKAAVERAISPNAKPPKPKKLAPPKLEKQVAQFVSMVLAEWTKNVEKHNVAFANARLAKRLMRNGDALIRSGYETDKLSALIRLSNELVRNAIDEGDDDARIAKLQQSMARTDITDTTPVNADAGEDEPEEPEDGE
jgi:hypothetical protein